MESEEICWSKTLLNIYDYLETICGAIDKSVIDCGIHSACGTNTEFVANKMIELTQRKKFLINVKVALDDVLCSVESENARLLTLRYIDKVKTDMIGKVLGISSRTYFRKIVLAIKSFAYQLKCKGYTNQFLSELFKNEEWVLDIYSAMRKKGEKKLCLENLNFLSIAIKSFKKRAVYGTC